MNYYPFGLKHKGYNNVTSANGNSLGQKKKTYQGQEWHDDLGLNLHEWKYRFSDPALGRFISIDPIAENYAYNSTYAFAENKLGLGGELEGKELFLNKIISRIAIGYARISNKIKSGSKKVTEAHNEIRKQKTGIPDPSFDSEKQRIKINSYAKMAVGLGEIGQGVSDVGHLTLDVIGIADPTGLADGVNSLWYAAEGDYLNASIAGAAILPYIGDSFKVIKFAKFSDEAAGLIKTTGKLDGGKEIISVLKEGTLDNGIKAATDVIGGLGDDAVAKIGKFGSQDGVQVGFQSANGKKGWRIDYDAKKGGHINWWNGKEKGAILLNAGQDQIDQIIKNQVFK